MEDSLGSFLTTVSGYLSCSRTFSTPLRDYITSQHPSKHMCHRILTVQNKWTKNNALATSSLDMVFKK